MDKKAWMGIIASVVIVLAVAGLLIFGNHSTSQNANTSSGNQAALSAASTVSNNSSQLIANSVSNNSTSVNLGSLI
jgi:hypothetical protein